MASVLIVEDVPDVCDLLRRVLEESGNTVTCVSNGREALRRILHDMPDVVLLDLMTPEMDGPTFLEVIRSYVRLRELPVVVLTGLNDNTMTKRAHAAGVNGVLVKGRVSLEQIQRAVADAIGHSPLSPV